jgi:putative tricarboxylic transport membrane protein
MTTAADTAGGRAAAGSRAENFRRVLALVLALTAAGGAAAQEWRPQRNVDLVVNSGAGGAADRQSRVAQKFLQSLPGVPSVSVTNRAGGGGLIALSFIAQHPGDPHYLGVLSTSVLTNQITGLSRIGYQDITPLNILVREYIAVWTRSESPIVSGRDLIARIRRDPASVVFAFSTARGNQNHVVIGMFARAAGLDPKALKMVIYPSGGQGMTAALGGHVDVWVGTAGGALSYMANGSVRVLGITAPQRQPGKFAAVPTFREQNVDASYYAWRGFLAPKGLTPAQIAFWDQAFARVAQSDEWRRELEENAWAEGFLGSADTRRQLDAEFEMLSRMLADLGVAAAR